MFINIAGSVISSLSEAGGVGDIIGKTLQEFGNSPAGFILNTGDKTKKVVMDVVTDQANKSFQPIDRSTLKQTPEDYYNEINEMSVSGGLGDNWRTHMSNQSTDNFSDGSLHKFFKGALEFENITKKIQDKDRRDRQLAQVLKVEKDFINSAVGVRNQYADLSSTKNGSFKILNEFDKDLQQYKYDSKKVLADKTLMDKYGKYVKSLDIESVKKEGTYFAEPVSQLVRQEADNFAVFQDAVFTKEKLDNDDNLNNWNMSNILSNQIKDIIDFTKNTGNNIVNDNLPDNTQFYVMLIGLLIIVGFIFNKLY